MNTIELARNVKFFAADRALPGLQIELAMMRGKCASQRDIERIVLIMRQAAEDLVNAQMAGNC